MADDVKAPNTVQERRRAPRVPLVAKGQVVNHSTAGTPPFEAFTSDVSEGGIRLSSNHGENLSLHDFLVISLPKPEGGESIQYKAQVAWIVRPPRQGQGAWSFGCSFFQMTSEAVLHLLVRAHRHGGRAPGGSVNLTF